MLHLRGVLDACACVARNPNTIIIWIASTSWRPTWSPELILNYLQNIYGKSECTVRWTTTHFRCEMKHNSPIHDADWLAAVLPNFFANPKSTRAPIELVHPRMLFFSGSFVNSGEKLINTAATLFFLFRFFVFRFFSNSVWFICSSHVFRLLHFALPFVADKQFSRNHLIVNSVYWNNL